MATGASTADLAVLLVDARAGILEQTRRHATIVSLMGISQVVVAINKIDLVDYDQKRFETLEAEFHEIARRLGIASVTAIPTSAVKGENVAFAAQQTMQWYQGPTLLQTLERATKRSGQSVGFRMPVQRVCRPDESFRGYQGTIAGGAVKPGDSVMILPSGETANVSRIVTFDLVRNAGVAGDAVTLVLDRQVDVSRGDMIASIEARPHVGHAFDANLIVLDAAGLRNEGRYWLKSGSRRQSVTVHGKAVLDLQTGDWDNDTELSVNRIASVQLQFVEPAVFDAYDANRETGSFILIDLDTNNTVAGGMIVAPSSNVTSLEPKGAQSVDTLAHEHSGMTAVILPTSLAEKLQESGLIDSEHAKFAALNHSQLAALRDGSEGKNG
jgi:sulfate adenylyltransferase subunit 1